MQKNYSVISACDNLLRKVLPILLVLALPWAAAGQSTPPTLTWSTDTTRIRIGEQIHLGLEVRAPKDALVDFPEAPFPERQHGSGRPLEDRHLVQTG